MTGPGYGLNTGLQLQGGQGVQGTGGGQQGWQQGCGEEQLKKHGPDPHGRMAGQVGLKSVEHITNYIVNYTIDVYVLNINRINTTKIFLKFTFKFYVDFFKVKNAIKCQCFLLWFRFLISGILERGLISRVTLLNYIRLLKRRKELSLIKLMLISTLTFILTSTCKII